MRRCTDLAQYPPPVQKKTALAHAEMPTTRNFRDQYFHAFYLLGLFACFCITLLPTIAASSVCAEVRIEIRQKLSFERQAFDAVLKINNGLPDLAVENIGLNLWFKDLDGNTVLGTTDANDTTAAFFLRLDALNDISGIDGNGQVDPEKTGEVRWLIIPTPGAGGATPAGQSYQVGADLTYTIGSETETVNVVPEIITVKPLPQLTLDYFLPHDVYADDPLTTPVEPIEPFTLGVRIKNSGGGASNATTIESAQPTIVDNDQGLLIAFRIIESYINNDPASKTLLINFGDIEPGESKIGRWNMTTTLMGRFTDFEAEFTHSDTLGGAATSLVQAVNTHVLVNDVKVDLPGRDNVRDFLAVGGSSYKVYESDGTDSEVIDQSANAQLQMQGNGHYNLNFPATPGFSYVKLVDTNNGLLLPGSMTRSDGKVIPSENIWLSKTRNDDDTFSYFINFFDTDSTGEYDFELAASELVSVSGIVFDDLNKNNTYDTGEPGIGVVPLYLTGTDSMGQGVNSTAYTDEDGGYSFINLQPGTYALEVGTTPSRIDGEPMVGSAGGDAESNMITAISLAVGTDGIDYFFAKQLPEGNDDAADVAVVLSSSASQIGLNEQATLTLTVQNQGPAIAEGINTNFVLPAGLTIISAIPSTGSYAGNIWQVDNLVSGAFSELVIVVEASIVQQYDLTATASSQNTDLNQVNNVTSLVLNGDAPGDADVRISVTASHLILATNDQVTYTIDAANFGPDTATGLALTITNPANLGGTTITPSTGNYAAGEWTVGNLNNGDAAFLTIQGTLLNDQPATLAAVISAIETGDPRADNDNAAVTVNASGVPTDIALDMASTQTQLTVNATTELTYTVSNQGVNPAAELVIVTGLAGHTSIHSTASNASVGAYNTASAQWLIPVLAAGEIAELTLTVQAVSTSPTIIIGQVAATTADPSLANNEARIALNDQPRQANVEISQTIDKPQLQIDEIATVVVSVTNTGPVIADSVVVSDYIPAGIDLVNASTSDGNFNVINSIWSIGNLGVNQTVTLTLELKLTASGHYQHAVHASASVVDPILSSNQSSVELGSSEFVLGDSTGDGLVTIQDVIYTINLILGNDSSFPINGADINGDGEVTIQDIIATINLVLAGP